VLQNNFKYDILLIGDFMKTAIITITATMAGTIAKPWGVFV
jgi:hypothetical protein